MIPFFCDFLDGRMGLIDVKTEGNHFFEEREK